MDYLDVWHQVVLVMMKVVPVVKETSKVRHLDRPTSKGDSTGWADGPKETRVEPEFRFSCSSLYLSYVLMVLRQVGGLWQPLTGHLRAIILIVVIATTTTKPSQQITIQIHIKTKIKYQKMNVCVKKTLYKIRC